MSQTNKFFNALLKPSVLVLGRMSYVKKFSLACAMFAIPYIFSTLTLFVDNQNAIEKSIEKQMVIKNLTAIQAIHTDFINVRNDYVIGPRSLKNSKEPLIQKLSKLAKDLNLPLHSTTYRALVGLQASVKVEFEGAFTEGSSLYSRLNDLDDILAQVNHLAELYIIDNDIFSDDDIYSLNLASLIVYYFNAPISRMEKINLIGSSILKKGYIDSQGIYSLQYLSDALRSDYSKLSLRLKNNYANYQNNEKQYSRYLALLSGFNIINSLIEETILFDPDLNANVSVFQKTAKTQIANTYKLRSLLNTALISRYDERSAHLKKQQINTAVFMVTLVFTTGYIFIGVFMSTKHSLNQLIKASKRVYDGDLTTPIQINTQDEFFELASYFEAMRFKLKQKGDELHKATMTDTLTGLYNRRNFDAFLDRHLQQCKKDQSDLILMIVDLDYFKKINDVHGHLVGDKCLQQTAKLLKQAITRNSDRAFRYGGEEFAIILPPISNTNGTVIAERFCQSLRSHTLESPPITFTASIGIASTSTIHSYESQKLISCADQALYTAKESGRDKYIIYSDIST